MMNRAMPSAAVEIPRLIMTVANVEASLQPEDTPVATIEVEIVDKKMRPASCTCPIAKGREDLALNTT
jgi:hypothetical protein